MTVEPEPHRSAEKRIKRTLMSRKLATGQAVGTLAVAIGCGVAGLFVSSFLWYLAILLGLSSGLAYVLIAGHQSHEDLLAAKTELLAAKTEINETLVRMESAIDASRREFHEMFMALAEAIGKLTPIPVPDDVFRHAIQTLEEGRGNGGWERVCIYAPMGIWMESKPKDKWLSELAADLAKGYVKQCWGVYGLAPKSKAADWHAHGDRRLRLFINEPRARLRYLPPEDDRHPGAARGLGILIFESSDELRYRTIYLFMGDSPESRGGYMIDDRNIGRTVIRWFSSHAYHGCSENFILRPEDTFRGQSPAEYMTGKLVEIAKNYPRLGAAA
jgi:hypothetical protein